jgi:S-adenosylmethionine decarboxylase
VTAMRWVFSFLLHTLPMAFGLVAGTPEPALTQAEDEMATADAKRRTLGSRLRAPGAVEGYPFIGRHMFASYVGCDAAALRDHAALEATMARAVEASGATRLATARHVFPPDGLTVVMLVSESHASIHTYPEHNSCFIDLFTCGTRCRAEEFEAVLRAYLRPQEADVKVFLRHARAEAEELRA